MKFPLGLDGQSRVLFFAPHPDDESLGTGGLLQVVAAAGAAIRVAFVTDGDNNAWMQRIAERRWRIGATRRAAWGALRRKEALAALESLGIAPDCAVFLGLPDQKMTELLLTDAEETLLKFTSQIIEWRPTLLVGPSTLDVHPDHSAVAVFLCFASLRLGPDQPPFKALSYLVHSPVPGPEPKSPVTLSLLPEQQERKRQALLCHKTQLHLGKNRLLRHVTGSETYIPYTSDGQCGTSHPIRRAVLTESNLQLEISTRARKGAFGRKSLYIACAGQNESSLCRFAPLPNKPASIGILDALSKDVVSRGHFQGNRKRGEILVPLSALPHSEKMFAKLERRFGFFDEAGWLEILDTACKTNEEGEGGKALPEKGASSLEKPLCVCCVIPCYNIQDRCADIVSEAGRYVDQVIAVNDGSTDETGRILQRIAGESKGRIRVISLLKNCGKGAALMKGFRYALEKLSFDVLVTLDGNGRYKPSDIPGLVKALEEEKAEMAVGDRSAEQAAAKLRTGERLTGWMIRMLYRKAPRDAQSTIRAFRRGLVEQILERIKAGGYETELYMLLLALETRKPTVSVPVEFLQWKRKSPSHLSPAGNILRIYKARRSFRKV